MRRPTSLLTWLTTAAVLSLAAGALPGAAEAAPPKKARPEEKQKKISAEALAALEKQLAGDEESVLAALARIAEEDLTDAAPLLAGLLGRGGSPKILEEAMKTAGKLKLAELSAAVAPYTRHRADDIRRAAVRTLIKTGGPVAVTTLRQALRSADAAVRGTAATGLGTLGARDALPDLFTAFDRGVGEAGASIGQICVPEECEKYAERTGRIAFDVMVSGFDQILFRPAAQVPDEAKLRLVGRLRELGTPEAGKFLADVSERWPKEWSTKIKQALDAGARSVAGAGGGEKK
jgi:hypothetical protein